MTLIPGQIWRHKKSGGLYRIVTECCIEASVTAAVAYRSETTEIVWVRPVSEFLDGRFERISEPPQRDWRDDYPPP